MRAEFEQKWKEAQQKGKRVRDGLKVLQWALLHVKLTFVVGPARADADAAPVAAAVAVAAGDAAGAGGAGTDADGAGAAAPAREEDDIHAGDVEVDAAVVHLDELPDTDDGDGNMVAAPATESPAMPPTVPSNSTSLTISISDLPSKMKNKDTKEGNTYSVSKVQVCARDLSEAALVAIVNSAADMQLYDLEGINPGGALESDYISKHTEEKDKKKAEKELQRAIDDIVRAGPANREVYVVARGRVEVVDVLDEADGNTTAHEKIETFVIRLDAAVFDAAVERTTVRPYYEGCTQFALAFSDKRKKTRGRYWLVTQQRWMDNHKGTRTLTFLQKFSAHLRFCGECGMYRNGRDIREGLCNVFPHATGDHTACLATCKRLKPKPWQRNTEFQKQMSALEQIVRKKVSVKRCEGFVDGLKTHALESFWGHTLTWRPKNIHFSTPACRARCHCSRLEWNARRGPCSICKEQSELGAVGEDLYRSEWRKRGRRLYLYCSPPAAGTRR